MTLLPTKTTHDPRLIYSGPIGTGTDQRRWDHRIAAHNNHFIYWLHDRAGQVVYIGKTWNPYSRFGQHRKRTWWSEVRGLKLYMLRCDCRQHATDCVGRSTAHWEARAIAAWKPRYNRALLGGAAGGAACG